MALTVDSPLAVRRSSDLSKHSAEVFAEAENHPVTVTRRDGESLVLMSQREADARNELLNIAATLITVSLEDGPLTNRMASRYPWMYALTPQDQEQCARDLIDAARASFSTLQPHLAITKLTSWRETAAANAAGVPVPLKDGYTLDADMFIQTVNQNSASLAVICNPNNPTGQLMTTAEIEYIAKEISCAFLIDEAYAEFSEHSVFQLLKKYPHMMIARTFSKAYALASCRVGYMLAHRDVIDMIAKTYMPYHMNVPSLVTADTVFQMRSEFEPQIRMICEERERMQEKYKELDAVTVYPSHTNFILIHYPHAEALNKEFIKYGIGVRSFGKTPRLENTLRISIGRTDENDAVYRVMKAFVEGNP